MQTPITIQASIARPISMVWESYTEPKHIVNWNFAADTWCCPRAENDMTIGGKYLARMEAKDGSFGFDFEAIYTAIEPGKSFTYEMENRKVNVSLKESNGTTVVQIIFDPEDQNPRELQEQGWQMILNNFKDYTESL